jgi:hypothetical protein
MPNGQVKPADTRILRKPTTVKFKTKSGKTVSFRAVRTFEQGNASNSAIKK